MTTTPAWLVLNLKTWLNFLFGATMASTTGGFIESSTDWAWAVEMRSEK